MLENLENDRNVQNIWKKVGIAENARKSQIMTGTVENQSKSLTKSKKARKFQKTY